MSQQLVVACRERDYDLSLRDSAEAFKLQPLQADEIQTYLFEVLGPKARSLLSDIFLDSKMVSLAANPLMLWLISVVAQTAPDARLPANKGRLFQQFVFDMPRLRASEGLGSRTSFDVVIAVLAKLGFEMQERRKITDDLSSARSYLLPTTGQRLEDLLAQAKEWRFLRSDGAMGDQIEFLHQLFLEYFAAAHLDSQLRAGHSFADVIGDRHYSELWWGEVITMLAGISNRPAELVVWLSAQCMLKEGASVLGLAMRCLETSQALDDEAACQSVAEAIAVHIDDWMTRRYGTPRILGAIGKFAVEPLIRAFRDGNAEVRSEVFHWLVMIGKPAVELLLPRLKDEDPELRILAADALGDIRDTRAIEPLIAALEDQNPDMRASASMALSKQGAAVARPLRSVLNLKDARLRRVGVELLGKLNVPEAIEPLVESLQDQDSSVRWVAAKGLGETKNWQGVSRWRKRAVEALDSILRSDDPSDREFAAFALGKVGGSRARKLLINALKDESSDIRYRAISAIGEIHGTTNILTQPEPLIAVLKDENELVRCKASTVLEQYGVRAAGALIIALRYDDENVRSHALDLLARSTFHFVEGFILVLKDRSRKVRRLAAIFLWQIADVRAVGPLVAALNDEDEAVRTVAADALGKINDLRAVEPLIAALNDKSARVRSLAAFALNKIGDERAVEPLMTALRDQEAEVRWFAADALCQIGDRRALSELRRVAKEDDTQTPFGNVAKAARNAVRRILLSHIPADA